MGPDLEQFPSNSNDAATGTDSTSNDNETKNQYMPSENQNRVNLQRSAQPLSNKKNKKEVVYGESSKHKYSYVVNPMRATSTRDKIPPPPPPTAPPPAEVATTTTTTTTNATAAITAAVTTTGLKVTNKTSKSRNGSIILRNTMTLSGK